MQDYLLIQKIKMGDTQAWEDLVNKYYDQIFAYCVRRCYGNRVLAADLTQDIFLKLVESMQEFRFTGKFFNYLFTITINTCNNYYNKKKFNHSELDETVLNTSEERLTDSLVSSENSATVQAALDCLPDIQREALILKFYYDLKVKEIAKITDVGVATTQSRINQGLKKLNKVLVREELSNG